MRELLWDAVFLFREIPGRNQAGVAQLVEHLICNQRVGGSNPFASSSFDRQQADAARVSTATHSTRGKFPERGLFLFWLLDAIAELCLQRRRSADLISGRFAALRTGGRVVNGSRL